NGADGFAQTLAVRRKSTSHLPSDGVLVREITLRQRFANDCYFRIGRRVLLGEKTAPQQRNPHHAKIVGTHRSVIGGGGFAGREWRIPYYAEPTVGCALAVHREGSRQSRILQTRLHMKPS